MEFNRIHDSWLKSGLTRLFIKQSTLPPFIQLFFMLFQFFLFIIFATSEFNSSKDVNELFKRSNLIYILGVILLTRFLLGINFIRVFYILFIYWIMGSPISGLVYIEILMIGLLILIDICSKIQYSFNTSNIQSESFNLSKIVHYLVMCVCILISNYIAGWRGKTVCLVLFIIAIGCKSISVMKNPNIKQIYIRFYLFCMLIIGMQLIKSFLYIPNIYINLISLVASQGLYTFFRPSGIQIEQLISKEKVVQLAFQILSYIYEKYYNPKSQKAILKLLQVEELPNLYLTLDNIQQISHKLLLSMKPYNQPSDLLIKAQIELFCLNSLLRSKKSIDKARFKLSFISWITSIQIYRMQERIKVEVQQNYNFIKQQHFPQFIQNYHFNFNLLKNSKNYLTLWDYLQSSQIIYDKLNKYLFKIITSSHQLNQTYHSLPIPCLHTTLQYIDYLYIVQRDVKEARLLYEKLTFNQQFQINLSVNSKIYMRMKIQDEEGIVIQKVGTNIAGLLGYTRGEIEGYKMQILLPQFYRQEHQILSSEYLLNQEIYHFKKSTIVRSNKGYYQPCTINIKLTIGNQLEYVGYVELLEDEVYNWQNYLFIREDTGDIVQCSNQNHYKKLMSMRKNVNTFFETEDQSNTKTYKHVEGDLIYQYTQVKQFLSKDGPKIILYVCQNPFYDRESKDNQQRIPNRRLPLYQSNPSIQSYTQQYPNILSKIQKSMPYLLLIVLMIIIASCLALQIYQYRNFEVKQKLVFKHINQTAYNLIASRMGITSLSIYSNLLYIQSVYKYTNQQYNFSLTNAVQQLQYTNNRLKQFSIDRYQVIEEGGVLSNLTVFHLVSNLYSQLISIKYQNFSTVNDMIYNYFYKNQEVILFTSLYQQPYRFIDKLNQISYKNKIDQMLELIFIIVTVIGGEIILIFLQRNNRVEQFEVLQSISKLGTQIEWRQNTNEFIKKITGDQNYDEVVITKQLKTLNQPQQQQNSIAPSEISNRENTLRDLMNDTSRHENVINPALTTNSHWFNKNNIQSQPNPNNNNNTNNSNQIKLKPCSKLFIIVSVSIVIILISLITTKVTIFQLIGSYDAARSTSNLVELIDIDLTFSTIFSSYLSSISRQNRSTLFDKAINKLNNIQNNIITFDQNQFDQFADFKDILRNMKYNYLCDYAACKSTYSDKINLIYNTAIQKMIYLMQQTISNTNMFNKNNTDLPTLLYTQNILRQVMNNATKTYFTNFRKFQSNNKKLQIAITISIIVILSILVLLSIIKIIFVKKIKNIYQSYINIIKPDSYETKQ